MPREGIDETLTYHDLPWEHHRDIYTNNPQEAIYEYGSTERIQTRTVSCESDLRGPYIFGPDDFG
jgi:transposase-like protein